MYELLNPGQRLLDIGIGTGISSRLFHKAGLNIYGVDGSREMLKVCEQKRMATGLSKIDLTSAEDPFPGVQFDNIISNGVFHIIGDLESVFNSISIKAKSYAYIGFTLDNKDYVQQDGYKASEVRGIFMKKHHQSGIMM